MLYEIKWLNEEVVHVQWTGKDGLESNWFVSRYCPEFAWRNQENHEKFKPA